MKDSAINIMEANPPGPATIEGTVRPVFLSVSPWGLSSPSNSFPCGAVHAPRPAQNNMFTGTPGSDWVLRKKKMAEQ